MSPPTFAVAQRYSELHEISDLLWEGGADAAPTMKLCYTHNGCQAGVDGLVLNFLFLAVERGHHDRARPAASLSASELGSAREPWRHIDSQDRRKLGQSST